MLFRWPGDPIGSCPTKGFFACQTQQRVIGCTHHQPFYNALLDRHLYSISIIRHPNRRSISAFFYPGIHHNEDCTKAQRGRHECFLEYTADPRLVGHCLSTEFSTIFLCGINKHSLGAFIGSYDHCLLFIKVAKYRGEDAHRSVCLFSGESLPSQRMSQLFRIGIAQSRACVGLHG